MIIAQELFALARKVELDIATLYEDIATHFHTCDEAQIFFKGMAAQEYIHVEWVDDMIENVSPDFEFAQLNAEDFEIMLSTVEDVRAEILEKQIGLSDAIEILRHLETSTAENFYDHFPDDIKGMPKGAVERMVNSCKLHAEEVKGLSRFI